LPFFRVQIDGHDLSQNKASIVARWEIAELNGSLMGKSEKMMEHSLSHYNFYIDGRFLMRKSPKQMGDFPASHV